MNRAFRVMRVDWQDMGATLALVREKVFVYEMRNSRSLELDGDDPACIHVLAVSEDGEAIGTGRIDQKGLIGHIAVLMPWRQMGVGSAILTELIAVARDNELRAVKLHAPLAAQEFYEDHNFQPAGAVYMDAGEPFLTMRLQLPTNPLISHLNIAY